MNKERVEDAVRVLLEEMGEDVLRPELQRTPARVAKWLDEFVKPHTNLEAVFPVVGVDQMVAVCGVRVWSLCEHHMLPFYCDLDIAYIPDGKIVGLSKLARIAHACAGRLQVQERLVEQIADKVQNLSGAESVAVYGSGAHLCMIMRGVKTEGIMSTQVLRGSFKNCHATRAEFIALRDRAQRVRF